MEKPVSASTGNFTFELFDVNGKLVRAQTGMLNQNMSIQKNDLSSGVYFYRVSKNGETLGSGKLIVE